MAKRKTKQKQNTVKKVSKKSQLDELTKSLTKSCKVILVRDDFRAGEQTLKKKPNPKKKSSKKPQNHLIRVYKFEVGQQVFAKMRGFASWPAKITKIEKNKMTVHFYGDNSHAVVFSTTLVPFDEGLASFTPGKRILLDKAVKESLYEKQKTYPTAS